MASVKLTEGIEGFHRLAAGDTNQILGNNLVVLTKISSVNRVGEAPVSLPVTKIGAHLRCVLQLLLLLSGYGFKFTFASASVPDPRGPQPYKTPRHVVGASGQLGFLTLFVNCFSA